MRSRNIIHAIVISLGLTEAAAGLATETKPAAEILREKIFGDLASKPACHAISTGPGVKLEATDKKLHQFIDGFVTKLKNADPKGLDGFFHPRAKVGKDIGESIFHMLDQKYEKPRQISVYRVWALNSPEGHIVTPPCPGDGVSVTTRYGYPLQIGLWLQVLGKTELGRIFAEIAPVQDKWFIVGFHVQQWTHKGKDHEAWAKEALAEAGKGDKVAAYVKFDVAQKLLWGAEFIHYDVKNELMAARERALNRDHLLNDLKALLKEEQIVYVGTVLGDDGAGFLIREEVSPDLATPDLQKRCIAKGKTLIKEKWLKGDVAGLQCSFVLKGEDPTKEGRLGGFYYSMQDLKKKTL